MSADRFAWIECRSCGGKGCDECDGGRWKLDQCPVKYIGSKTIRDIANAIKFSRYARSGSWPVAGGVLDQSRWFWDFCNWSWPLEDEIRANLKLAALGADGWA